MKQPRAGGGLLKGPGRHGRRRKWGSTSGDFILPAVLILLAVATAGLIAFAAGILIGLIPYQ